MMRPMSLAILTSAALLLAGCATERPDPAGLRPQSDGRPGGATALPPMPGGGTAGTNGRLAPGGPAIGSCNPEAARYLIGQIANVEATEAAKAATGAETVRVLYPNQPITQEFVSGRLNLETDNANRVSQVRCG
ncbi:I78 family peptidase inhibitor [Aurantimonas sp. A2-1-M11]|uniref:I78 family peptidase inhibitor n=1 Tax=Aurantimonas sp. A2-1-M11 TaxID=3113712 RepID=UPI002F959284